MKTTIHTALTKAIKSIEADEDDIILELLSLAYLYFAKHHAKLAKAKALTAIVAGLALKQITSKAGKRAKARNVKRKRKTVMKH